MGNANIDEALKRKIDRMLGKNEFRWKYQNLKGFIDNACMNELERSKKKSD